MPIPLDLTATSESEEESTTNKNIPETSTFREIPDESTQESATVVSIIAQEGKTEDTEETSTYRDEKAEVTSKFLIIVAEETSIKDTEQETSTQTTIITSTEVPVERSSTKLPTFVQNKDDVTIKNESSSAHVTVSWPVFIAVLVSYLLLVIIVLVTAYLTLPMTEPVAKPTKDITIVVVPPENPPQSSEAVIDVEFDPELLHLLPVEFLDISMDFIPLAESTVIKRPMDLDATYSWVWDSSMFTEDSIQA